MTVAAPDANRFSCARCISVQLLTCCLLCSLFILTGCGGGQPEEQEDSASSAGTVTDSGSLLSNAVDMLQPDRMYISSDVPTAMSVLNNWVMVDEEQGTAVEIPVEQLQARIGPEVVVDLQKPRFIERDCWHIHGALLARRIVASVSAGAANDRDRVNRLFTYVLRNTALQKPPFDRPMIPSQIVTYGLGTPEDRAWLFAELCRQLQIDTLLLTLPSAAGDGPADWLVGVCLADDLLLFDMRLGVPVCRVDDEGQPVFPFEPASFADWSTQAACWAPLQWSDTEPYPLAAEKLKQCQALIITNSDLWSQRIKRLQLGLVGDLATVVYQNLLAHEDQPGTIDRVKECLDATLKVDTIGVWAYPERRLRQQMELSDDEKDFHQRMNQILAAPNWVELDATSQPGMETRADREKLSRGLRATRIDHLTGNEAEAIAAYQSIRYYVISRMDLSAAQESVTQQGFQANLASAETSTFWSGMCQLAHGDSDSGINSLRQYLRQFPSSLWSNSAVYHMGRAQAETGHGALAIETLELIPDSAPCYPAARVLLKVIRPTLEAAEEQTESTESPSSDTEPADAAETTPGREQPPAEAS